MYRAIWTGVRLPSDPFSISWRCIRVQKPYAAPFLMKNVVLYFIAFHTKRYKIKSSE